MNLNSNIAMEATVPSTLSSSTAASESPSAVLEDALVQVRADLLVRSQVQDVLQEMVVDIELAHQLSNQLRDYLAIRSLEEKVEQHQTLLEERAVLDAERRCQEEALADRLVLELWSMSQEVGELKKIRAEHRKLLMQHDEVVAQLLQAQEDLAEARERTSAGLATTAASSGLAGAAAVATGSTSGDGGMQRGAVEGGRATSSTAGTREASKESPAEVKKQQTAASPDPAPSPAGLTSSAGPGTVKREHDSKPVASDKAASENFATKQSEALAEDEGAAGEKEAEPAPAVALLEEDEERDGMPRLEELDETILMRVFSFLDALDILNTAQVNVSMYSRVDALFFGGGNEPVSDAAASTTFASSEATEPRVAPPPAVLPATASQSNSPPTASTSATTAKSPPPPITSATVPSPTVVKLPPPSTPSKTSATVSASASTALTPAGSTSASSGVVASPSRAAAAATSLFSSILQPRLPVKPTSSASGASAGVATTTTAGLMVPHRRSASADAAQAQPPIHQHQPMNAAMANSMAAKLSDAELNAIIVMTERLKSREQLAEKLRAENRELRARLDGAETLQQYLAEKVRELEASVSSTEEQDAKTALQIASDQEVIAFLDAKVQELEAEAAKSSGELQEGKRERDKIQSGLEQKVKVLSDMLQFERERAKENEVEWKAARKVLVKEVRSLRAQLMALAAERDGYREQNEQLRRAVVAPFASASTPSSRVRQGSFS
jgi:hypothetical protein